MDKERLKIAFRVLGVVKEHFQTPKVYRRYDRGTMSKRKYVLGRGNFFYKSRSKKLAQKNIFYFVVSM